jgi:hypothetical protein
MIVHTRSYELTLNKLATPLPHHHHQQQQQQQQQQFHNNNDDKILSKHHVKPSSKVCQRIAMKE